MAAVEKVLRTALEFEEKGARFYRQGADRVHNPIVASVLLSLAADEEAHARLITQYHDAIRHQDGWSAAMPELPAAVEARNRLDETLQGATAGIRPDATYRAVYERARDLELHSRDFYREQAEAAPEPVLVKFFKFLGTVEQTHVEVLDSLLAAMDRAARPKDPG